MICNKDIRDFYDKSTEILNLGRKCLETIIRNPHANKALSTGRVIIVNNSVNIFETFSIIEIFAVTFSVTQSVG